MLQGTDAILTFIRKLGCKGIAYYSEGVSNKNQWIELRLQDEKLLIDIIERLHKQFIYYQFIMEKQRAEIGIYRIIVTKRAVKNS